LAQLLWQFQIDFATEKIKSIEDGGLASKKKGRLIGRPPAFWSGLDSSQL
jgi:hypothetical protein